jgi:hypothetical protein
MPYVTALDPEFLVQIEELVLTSAAAHAASVLVGQREWMYPPLQGWSGDPQAISDMNKAFIRDTLNALYKQVLNDMDRVGTVGESMVLKLQVDYIAAIERAFRTRHCSSVRARLHSASRRQGQAHSNGVFGGSVLVWLERLIAAAHDDPYDGVAPGDPPND